jgi:hypothetical protein
MTLEEHAHAIEAAIKAAAEDGFTLDDGDGAAVNLDLNDWSRSPLRWMVLDVPD